MKILNFIKWVSLFDIVENRFGSIPLLKGIEENSISFKLYEKCIDLIPDKYLQQLTNLADKNTEYNDIEVYRKYMKLGKAGASLRSLAHWRQLLKGNQDFSFYNFSKAKNIEIYG